MENYWLRIFRGFVVEETVHNLTGGWIHNLGWDLGDCNIAIERI